MDIDRVRYFCAFADLGSLTRTSELVRISQPALSKAIHLLERELGLKLVTPSGRGLRLTEAGRQFKAAAQPLLQKWLELPPSLHNAQSQSSPQTLKIGSFEVFTTYFLASLARYLSLDSIELRELLPGQIETEIAKGTIDVGISYAPIPCPGVRFVEATRIQMGVFGAANFKSTHLSDLPFVVPLHPLSGTPSKAMGLDGWPDHTHPRKVTSRVTLMESALQLCRSRTHVAYLPRFVVAQQNAQVRERYRLYELESGLPSTKRVQSVYLIQRSGESESPEIKKLGRALRSLSTHSA